MTRTAKTPRLMAHSPEPYVDIHPDDADALGLVPAAIAEIESEHGRMLARVIVSEQQTAGHIFVPMHWTGMLASRSRVGAVAGGATDAVSGQPELKHTAVAVRAFAARWHGFAVAVTKAPLDFAEYMAIARAPSGYRIELAGHEVPNSWDEALQRLLGIPDTDADILAYRDEAAGQRRFAAFADGRFVGALFVSQQPLLGIARDWLAEQVGRDLPPEERLRVLAGRTSAAVRDRGPIVCACLSVGRNEIVGAIVEGAAATVDGVSAVTKAGTNCGSCRSDIQRILDEARLAKAG